MTKVAVIGVGHLGRQHARLYADADVDLAGVVDIQKPRADEIAGLYKTSSFTDYRELLGKVDAVSLAVPTIDHARIGVDLLEHGIDVLVDIRVTHVEAATYKAGLGFFNLTTSGGGSAASHESVHITNKVTIGK